jgi:hypothetical protein
VQTIELFDRKFKLTVDIKTGASTSETWSIERDTPSSSNNDLRIKFEITQALKAESNHALVTIYNLSQDLRNTLHRMGNGADITLEAGYVARSGVVFKGTVKRAYNKQDSDGTTWLTEMVCSDFGLQMQTTRKSVSIAPGTSWTDVVKLIASSLSVQPTEVQTLVDKWSEADGARPIQSMPRGYAFSGRALDALTELVKGNGGDLTFTNGRLFLFGPTTIKHGPNLMFSTDSGVIGTPEVGTSFNKNEQPTMKFSTLLEPNASPGVGVELSFPDFAHQVWRAEQVVFDGDSHWDGNWQTHFQCKRVK